MYKRQTKIAQALIPHAEINGTDKAERTPLHYVQSLDALRLLLARGAKVNVQEGTGLFGNKGQTPLHRVPNSCIPLLLEKGADISTLDKDSVFFHTGDERGYGTRFVYQGLTPLMSAIARHSDSQRFATFLKHAPRAEVLMQANALTVLATFSENPEHLKMLNEYKQTSE